MNNSARENHSEWKTDKSIFKNAPIYFALDAGFSRTNVKKYRNLNNDIREAQNPEVAQIQNEYKAPGIYPKVRFSKNNFSQNSPTSKTQMTRQGNLNSLKNEKIQGLNDKNYNFKTSRELNSQVISEKNGEKDKKIFSSPQEFNKLYQHQHQHNNYTNINNMNSMNNMNNMNMHNIHNMNNYFHQQQLAFRNIHMANQSQSNNFPNMYFYDNNLNLINNTNMKNNMTNNILNGNVNVNGNANGSIIKTQLSHPIVSSNHNIHNIKLKSPNLNKLKVSHSTKNLYLPNQILYNSNFSEKKKPNSSFLNIKIKLQEEIKYIQVSRGEDYYKKASEFCYLNNLNPSLAKPILNSIFFAIESIDKMMLHFLNEEEHKLIQKIQLDFEEYKLQLDEEKLNSSCITIFSGGIDNTLDDLDLSSSKEKLNFSF